MQEGRKLKDYRNFTDEEIDWWSEHGVDWNDNQEKDEEKQLIYDVMTTEYSLTKEEVLHLLDSNTFQDNAESNKHVFILGKKNK